MKPLIGLVGRRKTGKDLVGMPAPLEATVEAGARTMALDLVGVDADVLIAAYEELLAALANHRAQQQAS